MLSTCQRWFNHVTLLDNSSEEVWYRVVQIVINRDDVQGYSAKTVFEALQAPACHENMVKVAGYILGEFGNLIAGDSRSGPMVSVGSHDTSFTIKKMVATNEYKDTVQSFMLLELISCLPDSSRCNSACCTPNTICARCQRVVSF